MPWIKIDFTADIERANAQVLPLVLTAEGNRHTEMTITEDLTRSLAQGL